MANPDLIPTLTGGLTAALALGYMTHRLGLSPIVGYLLAGIAVGPHTPGFVANRELADQLAEIGVVLLMFGVGLHFAFKDLLAVRRVALPGAIGQSLISTVLGTGVALAFGWNWSASVMFGLALSVASTVVLTRVLADSNQLHTSVGNIAVGWLVVQDLFAVLMLVLMPAVFGGEAAGPGGLPVAIGLAALKIGVLVAGVIFLGGRLIPWLLRQAAAARSRELFTLTILVVALGIAVGSSRLFGVSMALGAFLAGMVVGRSEFSVRAATEALPMRDAFAVLFFVSVGMLFNPGFLLQSPWLVAATFAVVLVGTPLATLGIVLALGYPTRVAITVALALGQIGEFSFILTALGRKLGVLSEDATHALVAVAIASISLSPLLQRLVDPLEAWFGRRPRLSRWLAALTPRTLPGRPASDDARPDHRHRAVVVGYGPVGQTLARLLRENGIEPTVIEMNLETVERLREEGLSAVYGDANHSATLKAAGVHRAASLILSASGLRGGEEVIRLARELNPRVRILVRSAYLRERPALRKAGADVIFAGEGEVALAMTESILSGLGATPEQIDRERERLRTDFFGVSEPNATIEPPPESPGLKSNPAGAATGVSSEAGEPARERPAEPGAAADGGA